MTEYLHCQATKSNGLPCKTKLWLSDAGLCIAHDPLRIEEARQMRMAGAKAMHEAKRRKKEEARLAQGAAAVECDIPPFPKNLEDATKYFAWIVDAIARGKIDARSGHEMSYALNGFKAAAEKRDMQREIKRLREQVAEANNKGPRRVA
jgi:hypothetical protein